MFKHTHTATRKHIFFACLFKSYVLNNELEYCILDSSCWTDAIFLGAGQTSFSSATSFFCPIPKVSKTNKFLQRPLASRSSRTASGTKRSPGDLQIPSSGYSSNRPHLKGSGKAWARQRGTCRGFEQKRRKHEGWLA